MEPSPNRELRRFCPLLLLALCIAAWAPAQQRARTLHLPAVPYDYSHIEAPKDLPGLPSPERSTGRADGVDDARATLGRVLFYDRRLSRGGAHSCASCHRQQHGFTDTAAHSPTASGQHTRRNTMALTNLAFEPGPFGWDAREASLEQFVLDEIEGPLAQPLDEAVRRVAAAPEYAPLLRAAYGSPDADVRRIAWALARFVRAITSCRSRYDEGLAAVGTVTAAFPNFTAAENRGKDLFFGFGPGRSYQRSCAACHVERRFGYCGNSFWFAAVKVRSDAPRHNGVAAADGDLGFGGVTGLTADRGRLRAPSLRNIELTGPYMHDGRFATLEQVVDYYAFRVPDVAGLDDVLQPRRPGHLEFGTPTRGALAPTPGLPMSHEERADLLAFLRTLTDVRLLGDPRFADPFAGER